MSRYLAATVRDPLLRTLWHLWSWIQHPRLAVTQALKRPHSLDRCEQSLRRVGQSLTTPAHTKQNRGWLRIKKGEILHTTSDEPQRQYNWYDGKFHVPRASRKPPLLSSLCYFKDTCHSPAYKAINSARGELDVSAHSAFRSCTHYACLPFSSPPDVSVGTLRSSPSLIISTWYFQTALNLLTMSCLASSVN